MASTSPRHLPSPDLVERGRLAFEAGRYFEAVSHWEVAWREELGTRRRLLQGLMQAAGAYHKRGLGEPRGMVKLLQLAMDQIGPLPDAFDGLRLELFRDGLRRSWGEAIGWSTGGPRPAADARLARVD